jgi:hypothetical protein
MGEGIERIHKKIRSFQRKYYLNVFIRGGILTFSIIIAYFTLAAILENALWLGPALRFGIFLSFFLLIVWCLFRFLMDPFRWWLLRKGLGEEESARMIGDHMPTVKDQLLNLLQLSRSQEDSMLAYASVRQKSSALDPLVFDSIIDLRRNRRFLVYLIVPIAVLLLLLIVNQQIITASTNRIIHFSQKFSPQAPFEFIVENKALSGFYNEDFNLIVRLEGGMVPDQVYVLSGNQKHKLDNLGDSRFGYTFENLQAPLQIQLEAAGFYSPVYNIAMLSRPELTGFQIELDYPAYIRKKDNILQNAGNLEVPEGTTVRWSLSTANTKKAGISFSSDSISKDFQISDNQLFTYSRRFLNTSQYEIYLKNDASRNRDRITYNVNVIKDQHPQISVNSFSDTVLFKRVVLGGIIADDYGLTQLELHYRILDGNQEEILNRHKTIPIVRDQLQQSFIYNWALDSIQLKPGHQLEYYLKVWDNDGVNGRKSTQSAHYKFFIPTEDRLVADINESGRQTQSKIDQSATKANNLRDQIEQIDQRLKGKQNLDWQDKKMLEDIIKQKENLDRLIREMSVQNKSMQEKRDAFTDQDERIREKAEQIQKLMDQLLDEKTRKLFDELQKLLKEKTDISQLQKLLDKLNQNTSNLEKELDRMLELFKQLEFESKFDQAVNELGQQVEKQQKLMDKTESLANEKDDGKKTKGEKKDQNASQKEQKTDENQVSKDLADEQEKLKDEFEQTGKNLEELRKLGEEIDQADEVPQEEKVGDVLDKQQQSQDMLEQSKPSNAKQSQQKAIDQMRQMQQQMEGAQNSSMMEIDMENLEALRHILHGLIKLSFDQEELMKDFNDLHTNDPRFNTLAEDQLQLQDNAKVLEDSLLALAKRDPFMGSFVTKEVSELNEHLDNATDANRERKRPQAQSEMQMAMTSINNLALMLDSHFDMMMEMMANAKPSMRKGKSKNKGQPNLSQLQQQLNQKIEELKNSGKGGRELSEELAEMAAEQERIRRAVQEMQEQMKKEGAVPGGDLPSKMEQTEMDLVNKQLTDQLIKRQQEILTRLLEAEKSMREQDTDEERKGETAKDYDKEIPKAFEEYLRLKEKEVELLKTIPPKLYPYYKKEVDDYFKRMSQP